MREEKVKDISKEEKKKILDKIKISAELKSPDSIYYIFLREELYEDRGLINKEGE
ncbi:MAG: hypothetical protein KA885_01875 [Spirochaetes bacterium]|nr:hypothetical protein [Spirochaetota bacterium]